MEKPTETRGTRPLGQGIRERLTYANVMSTIAVFGVLGGGGAYAASKIGAGDIKRNAVLSKHIKRGNVKRSDLGANAVSSSKVANGSLRGADVRNNSLTGLDIDETSLSGVRPSGPAGGALTGNYPSPGLAPGIVGTTNFGRIPAAHVTQTSGQSIPDGVSTTLAFDAERYDTAAMHDNATNNSRLRAPVTGVYSVTLEVLWEFTGTGLRIAELDKNGTTQIAQHITQPAMGEQLLATQVRLRAGDYVEARVVQSSGMALHVTKADEFSPDLSMTWLAPG
jgi:hypothetical protein